MMNICAVCGSDMAPLFSSLYCPNDCDKNEIRTLVWEGGTYRYIILECGRSENAVPKWVRYGWNQEYSDAIDINNIANHQGMDADKIHIGWPIGNRTLYKTCKYILFSEKLPQNQR